MRIEFVNIINFKLLSNISLDFSTDCEKPLTVIRAENGSGKTSILYALRWAFYGHRGIPESMRLTSTAEPIDIPVCVEVSIKFKDTDHYSGKETRYRLIRSCIEIPRNGDNYDRGPDQLRLLEFTDSGEIDKELGTSGQISAMFPEHLADIFFTNGDDVQRFIAGGRSSKKERQERVHDSIRNLLGFKSVEEVAQLTDETVKYNKRKLAASGGEKLSELRSRLDELEDKISEMQTNLNNLYGNRKRLEEQIQIDEGELGKLTGIGNLEEIQTRIRSLESDIDECDRNESFVRNNIKELLQSEDVMRNFLNENLEGGVSFLNKLVDRKVIPSSFLEVLKDRLDLGICICGETLYDNSPRHYQIRQLIENQQKVTPQLERYTQLLHYARNSEEQKIRDKEQGKGFRERADSLSEDLIRCFDHRKRKVGDLNAEKARRNQIDNTRVKDLTKRINSNNNKLGEINRKIGSLESQILTHQEFKQVEEKKYQELEKLARLNKTAKVRFTISKDFQTLASSILTSLKTQYVKRVSDRMNDLFLDIIGVDLNSTTAVIRGVEIDNKNYNIVINSVEGKTLDADTELFGAAQRALTLAFIWALMEVTEKEAPRIIDSPLGMTSGAVKKRMVDRLTQPTKNNCIRYQVILFMTRSEIRDIEDLITMRAGDITTLTCSKDYPIDLVYEWSPDKPIVETCNCDHTQICKKCERRFDVQRFNFRKT